jgi:hypothetical protein
MESEGSVDGLAERVSSLRRQSARLKAPDALLAALEAIPYGTPHFCMQRMDFGWVVRPHTGLTPTVAIGPTREFVNTYPRHLEAETLLAAHLEWLAARGW